jgi:DNA-binding NarL/FixJ family response regulator
MSIRLLLVEENEIVRQGIRTLFDGEGDIEICAEAKDSEEALALAKKCGPDLIVMEMNLSAASGLELISRFKKEHPSTKILLLCLQEHLQYLIGLVEAGAEGYVLKNCTKSELLFAIRKIASGGKYIGAEFTLSMLNRFRTTSQESATHKRGALKITDREMIVLNMVAEGKTNQEIAKELFTSVRTIETRRKNLLDKTGTTNTATLIKFAVQNSLVK